MTTTIQLRNPERTTITFNGSLEFIGGSAVHKFYDVAGGKLVAVVNGSDFSYLTTDVVTVTQASAGD